MEGEESNSLFSRSSPPLVYLLFLSLRSVSLLLAHSLVSCPLILPETCGTSSSPLLPPQFLSSGPTSVACPLETQVWTLCANLRQAFWDPSMWGYGVHMETFPYDNRPVAPLMNYTFDKWWFVSVIHSITSCKFQTPTIASSAWPLGLPPCAQHFL